MSADSNSSLSKLPHVVIVGGGFGGLAAARHLAKAPVRVTLVDRRNHHLFQPLLYQVATGGLSPANIAAPLRSLVERQRNTSVLLAEVVGADLEARQLRLGDGQQLDYDQLIVATGAGQSYFGNETWRPYAPGLKTIDDATRIRRQVLLAFERAEWQTDVDEIRRLMTFVVIGAGPTGVELAGAIAEVARGTLRDEFRQIEPQAARVILVEAADRVLPPFSEKLSHKAAQALERIGVEVRVKTKVVEVGDGVLRLESMAPAGEVASGGYEAETLPAATVLWAAGVAASPLGALLAKQSQAEVDRAGRVIVERDCSLAGRPEVFVIGDLASYRHDVPRDARKDDPSKREQPLPGLAPVATQQGRYVAKLITARHIGRAEPKPFSYTDKGSMAVISRKYAIAEFAGVEFAGFVAWLMWLFVHLMYIARFENRLLVLIQWGWNYLTRNRSARLITGKDISASKDEERQ